MIFAEGRYYYGQVMCPIAEFFAYPAGGDICGLLWRYDATPEEWVYTFRFRKYVNKNRPWDGQDKKTWYATKINGTEQQVAEKVRESLMKQALMTAALFTYKMLPPEWFLIQGDAGKALDLTTKSPPPWLHARKAKLDDKGEIVSMETDLSDEPGQ